MTIEEARKCFMDLGILDWEVKGVLKPGGQGITLKVLNVTTSELGVFKMPRTIEAKESGRFYREIEILSEVSKKDSGIAPLLKHSEPGEEPWFITKYGEPFKEYWRGFRDDNCGDCILLLKKALEIIEHLLDGLGSLHTRQDPIVHRDIKPDNIVVINGKPNLIDFGVAFWAKKERLTDINDAVGNKRFSPDKMMYRLDEVVPWVDVFMMSQLLGWMLAEQPIKRWDRPVDFRFVKYSPGFGDEIARIYALAGVCSEETIGPKNAREMLNLTKQLFYQTSVMEKKDLSKVVSAYQAVGKEESDFLASKLAEKALAQKKIDAVKALVSLKIREANDFIEELVQKFNDQGINAMVVRRNDRGLEDLVGRITANPPQSGFDATEMISMKATTPGGRDAHMGLSIYIDVNRAKNVENPFCFRMGLAWGYERFFYMDPKGQLYDRPDYTVAFNGEIVDAFREWFENPRNWF